MAAAGAGQDGRALLGAEVSDAWDRVEAHHLHALADGGEGQGEGVALCRAHHAQATAAQLGYREAR